jgi:hypothetical protein
MRRSLSLLAAALLLVALAAPVAAAGPERFWTEESELSFGPEYCGFPAQLVDSFSANKSLVFPPDTDGNVRIISPGVIRSTLTNLDSDASTRLNLGGKITIRIAGDGSAHVRGSGTIFLWYSPTEAPVAETGAGLFLLHGHATEVYSVEGALLSAEYTGRLIDLCAELGD